MRRTPIALIVLAVAATTVPGCAARAPDWPLRTTEIQTGPGTMEQVRRQLEGTWTLKKLDVLESGVPRSVHGQGALTYDGFGNLTMDAVILDPPETAASRGEASLLNCSGRVVIDPQQGELRLEDVRARPVDERAQQVLALSPVRRFRFEGDTLVLVLASQDGAAVARAEFARASATR